MNGRITIVLIALIGIGLYALPQTMALFAGQHSFTNIDPTGNQVECDKCHGDVNAELLGSANELTGTKPPHADMECAFCHRLQIGMSSGDSAYAIVEYQGTAKYISNGTNVSARRYLVLKTADYEAQKYPATISNNASITVQATMATAGGSLSTLYGANTTIDYSATVFGWNNTAYNGATLVNSRARQTDVINASGVGTVTYIARGTIFPLYNNSQPIDTNPITMNEAFEPTKVTWDTSAVTGPATQPAVVLNGAGSRTVNSGSRYHAASLVACMDCHAGASPQPGHETARLGAESPTDEEFCKKCHYGTEEPAVNGTSHLRSYALSAGGFGMGLTNEAFDSGEAEVHKPMVKAQDSISVYGGRMSPASNDGCIGCHTHVDVEITYQRPTTLTYGATEFLDGNWSVGGFGASGSNTTTG
jgi:hypothetical protein